MRELGRRAFCSALAFAGLAVACSKRAPAARCELCGMRLDPSSPWRAELLGLDDKTHGFDSPKCALLAWRRGQVPSRAVRIQEFYERAWLDGASVRFVVGSDVVGPMGPDLVPVDPARASKFATDHGGSASLELSGITLDVLSALH